MSEAAVLTPQDLVVSAPDGVEALVTLLKRYPAITRTDYSPEIDAFGVLLRAWMASHPNQAVELHLGAGQHVNCTFTRAGLPTDVFVDMLASIIDREYDQMRDTRYSGIGLHEQVAKLLVPVVTKPAQNGYADVMHIPVLLTNDLLYIGGHMIWQRN